MRYVALFALSLSFAASAAGFTPDLTHLDAVPMHAVSPAVVSKALAQVPARKDGPFQFAAGAPLKVTLAEGRWDRVDANTWSWRTRVFSAGAVSLNFEFAQFRMPEGGALWIYDAAGELVQGPYTAAQQTPAGKLWTAVVLGETAVIEARVPASKKEELLLELAQVNHGFRGFSKDGSYPAKAASGACNIDVACPQGGSWGNEIRSVARIQIGGQFLCTGQLVNNVRQDNTPYFLTANHCEIEQTPTTPASSVVFYWNYQNNQCGGGTNNNLTQSQSGSMLVAQDQGSDFTLLKLSQPPDPSFNVFYAGWNADSDVPQSGSVIHHPKGDVKKISLYNTPGQRAQIQICTVSTTPCPAISQRTIDAWQIQYSEGTTEEGSSGSSLWNQNHQMVGLLSGGDAACSSANPNVGNGGRDYYGRIEVAWNSPGQLKTYLAPNSSVLALCGKNPADGPCTTAAQLQSGVTTGSGGSGGGALSLASAACLSLFAALRRGRHRRSGSPRPRGNDNACRAVTSRHACLS